MNDVRRYAPGDVQNFPDTEYANSNNEYARFIDFVTGQIWSRRLKSIAITPWQ